MKEITSVEILINGRASQFEIARSTTCDDVIKTVSGFQNEKCYAVFETALGRQKMLPGTTKLLKQIRSWGSCGPKVTLEIKEVDKIKSKMASVVCAKAKLQKFRKLIMRHEMKSGHKIETYIHNNLCSKSADKDSKLYSKNITVLEKNTKSENRQRLMGPGKKELLKRYLTDSVEYNHFGSTDNSLGLPPRTSGVGCENNISREPRLPQRTRGDGREEIGTSCLHQDDNDMNTGFIAADNHGFHDDDITQDELNECIIYDDDESTSSEESASLEEDSDYESLCELERNIFGNDTTIQHSKITDIKRLFSKGDVDARLTDDDILESFMHTFVNDVDSDEGISSGGSDLGA